MHARQSADRELELLLACARWPQQESDRRLISEVAAESLDHARFIRLARHHRIVPIVSRNAHDALATAVSPGWQHTLNELKREAGANAMRTLRLVAELRRVLEALAATGVRARLLKGLPLAQAVFGEITLRSAGDLDLLIRSDEILNADRVLRDLGYRGLYPVHQLSPRQFACYTAHWKDVSYENLDSGIALDLHWRCFRNPAMPGNSLCSVEEERRVSIGGMRVATLPFKHELLYLCVHGTLDSWIFLKTLVDVATQVRSMGQDQLHQLVTLAAEHQVLPEFSATLHLVRRYFTLENWSNEILPRNHPVVRHIVGSTQRTLENRGFLASREDIPVAETLRFEWGLRRSLPYRRELVHRILYRARMWQTLPLPDRLFWMYPVLSPLEWVLFRMRRHAPVGPDAATSKMEESSR